MLHQYVPKNGTAANIAANAEIHRRRGEKIENQKYSTDFVWNTTCWQKNNASTKYCMCQPHKKAME